MKKINVIIIVGLIIAIALIIVFSLKSAPIVETGQVDNTTTSLISPENFPVDTIPNLEQGASTSTTLAE